MKSAQSSADKLKKVKTTFESGEDIDSLDPEQREALTGMVSP